jgi:hypothetical protein
MATATQKSSSGGHVGRDAAVSGSAAIAPALPEDDGGSHCRTALGSDGKGLTRSQAYAPLEQAARAARVPRDGARSAARLVIARRLMSRRSSSQCGSHGSIVTEAPSGFSVASPRQDDRGAPPGLRQSQAVIQHNGINDLRRQ